MGTDQRLTGRSRDGIMGKWNCPRPLFFMSAAKPPNQIRIIGGQWRGRKLRVPDAGGVRPTPDRVRETLFNWLAPVVAGSRVLDLYAGSGALGFEAASRGAAEVQMVERDPRVVRVLYEQVQLLRADTIQVAQSDALQYLRGIPRRFDIVLLDPPYGQDLLSASLALLEPDWLTPDAWLYIEAERELPPDQLVALLPAGFALIRSKVTGQVGYHLARRQASGVAKGE